MHAVVTRPGSNSPDFLNIYIYIVFILLNLTYCQQLFSSCCHKAAEPIFQQIKAKSAFLKKDSEIKVMKNKINQTSLRWLPIP